MAAGDVSARVIVNSNLLTHLKVLELNSGDMTDTGAQLLASSPHISGVRKIELNFNALSPVGVEALKATGVEISATDQHDGNLDSGVWHYEGDIE
jgi:hypothetical protein